MTQKNRLIPLLPVLILAGLFSFDLGGHESEADPVQRLVVGSCLKQDKPQPCWKPISKYQPDVLILCGDNIYGDSRDVSKLARDWATLSAQPDFAKLRKESTLLATWDDHDYGENDAGREYPVKKESQKVFLDWLGEPEDSPRRNREGVYESYMMGPDGQRVQIILLDTRYHRSALTKSGLRRKDVPNWNGPYVPSPDRQQQMLGEAQWKWLEKVLAEPAEVRLLVTSIQLIPDEHSWESWAQMPLERARLISLLRTSEAEGLIVVSGDRHAGEIMALPESDSGLKYPLYELTSSSLNASFGIGDEPNRFRNGSRFGEVNFGTIDLDWDAKGGAAIRLSLRNADTGKVLHAVDVPLSSLKN